MGRKVIIVLVLFLIGITVFAGGKEEQSVPAQGGTSPGNVNLTILTTAVTQEPEGPLFTEIFNAYLQVHPNIKAEIVGVPMNQALTRITTLAASSSTPDLFVNTEGLLGKLYDMGICEDFNPYLTNTEKANIIDSIRNGCSIDGKLIIYPWYTVPNGIVYRSDWFTGKGLKEPQNWDEFLKAVQALTEDTDKDGKIDRWGFGMVGTNDDSGQGRFVQFLRTFGARELYKENNKWKTDIGNDASIKAFQYFTELKTKYNIVPPGSLENSFNENVNLLAGNQIALLISGPHTTGKVFDMNPALKGKLGSMVIPKGTVRYTPLSVLGFSLSTESKAKKEAVDIIRDLTNKEHMIRWVEVTGRMPCTKDASEADYIKTPLFKGFLDAIAGYEILPDAAFYPEVKSILGKTYQKIMLTPGIDIQKEVIDAGKQIQNVIDQNS
jgi:multiple sugar transport system substrate-binding protein